MSIVPTSTVAETPPFRSGWSLSDEACITAAESNVRSALALIDSAAALYRTVGDESKVATLRRAAMTLEGQVF
jgi:hypothetical protein